jgi:hypothetical protein
VDTFYFIIYFKYIIYILYTYNIITGLNVIWLLILSMDWFIWYFGAILFFVCLLKDCIKFIYWKLIWIIRISNFYLDWRSFSFKLLVHFSSNFNLLQNKFTAVFSYCSWLCYINQHTFHHSTFDTADKTYGLAINYKVY